jgi:predicted secreted protein
MLKAIIVILPLVMSQTLTTVLDLRGSSTTNVFTVDIHMGNSLEILLTENPTTGHSWSVDETLLTRVTLIST